jgi:hypothetical protein
MNKDKLFKITPLLLLIYFLDSSIIIYYYFLWGWSYGSGYGTDEWVEVPWERKT